jgi:WD40-like Beta Propeller Repeat
MLRVLALVAFLLLLPATASATFDGTTGKVAYIDADNGLYIDDPYDDQPAQGPLATVSDPNFPANAPVSPPAWSPDGTMLAYSASQRSSRGSTAPPPPARSR